MRFIYKILFLGIICISHHSVLGAETSASDSDNTDNVSNGTSPSQGPTVNTSRTTTEHITLPSPQTNNWSLLKNALLLVLVLLVVVVIFLLVRYCRSERRGKRSKTMSRYTRLKTAGGKRLMDDADGGEDLEDEEEIELSIYEKK